jgi:putative protease
MTTTAPHIHTTAAMHPELLAPAGNADAMRAAVANGADAVYFGLNNFNARHRATNFTLAQLPEVMEFLHNHNVKGFLTFNTLVFSDELAAATDYIKAIAKAGVDAVIVQDLGIVRLIRKIAPQLPIHGSTQMTLTEPRGIEFVRKLGVQRVVLARELSLDEIKRIAATTTMPLEVFIHGALCVSYSGQCLTSESIGGRSANRGQCAQACRLPYQLIVDGQEKDLGDKAYLLSPSDLAAYDLIGDLTNLGVASFKIEGRLKSPHYVAATCQTYRSAIDAAIRNDAFVITPQQKMDLDQSFSRGFTHGFLSGVDHQKLVAGRFPKSRGIQVGTVSQVTENSVIVQLTQPGNPLKPGDGVVFDEGHPDQWEQGGRIFGVRNSPTDPTSVQLNFGDGDVNFSALSIGALVWKTDDPAHRRRLEQSYSRDVLHRRVPLTAHVQAHVGQQLRITLADGPRTASATWDKPLEVAKKYPLAIETLREQLGRLGDTPYELGEITLDANGDPMIPKSVMNDLRRQAVDNLMTLRDAAQSHPIADVDALLHLREEIRNTGILPVLAPTHGQDARATLNILVRTLDQLDAALAWSAAHPAEKPGMLYCDFEDIRRYKEAVARCRAAAMPIALATLRIVKPTEEGLLRQIADCQPDAVLVRNLAAVSFFSQQAPHLAMLGDYTLNVANEITASVYAAANVQRIVPSYDLNWQQLQAMLGRINPAIFEAVIHQHMPMFHMEHCVFAHTLSNGKDFHDCGRPCERHTVDLKDRVGEPHPLIPDVGCRNTLFNAQAQTAVEFVPQMKALGIRHFRVELLRESVPEVAPLLDRYSRVLSGAEDAPTAFRSLKVLNALGLTRGTLNHE